MENIKQQIIEFCKKNNKFILENDLKKSLKISGEEQTENFFDALKALEEEGSLFFDKKSIIISLIAVCLLPFYHFTSVGLYTGSVHYTWPVALLMYGLISIKKIINSQKLNVFEVILQFLCFIFVIFEYILNTEQEFFWINDKEEYI